MTPLGLLPAEVPLSLLPLHTHSLLPTAVFSTQGDFAPWGHLTVPGDGFRCHSWGRAAAGISWVEATDAARRPTVRGLLHTEDNPGRCHQDPGGAAPAWGLETALCFTGKDVALTSTFLCSSRNHTGVILLHTGHLQTRAAVLLTCPSPWALLLVSFATGSHPSWDSRPPWEALLLGGPSVPGVGRLVYAIPRPSKPTGHLLSSSHC